MNVTLYLQAGNKFLRIWLSCFWVDRILCLHYFYCRLYCCDQSCNRAWLCTESDGLPEELAVFSKEDGDGKRNRAWLGNECGISQCWQAEWLFGECGGWHMPGSVVLFGHLWGFLTHHCSRIGPGWQWLSLLTGIELWDSHVVLCGVCDCCWCPEEFWILSGSRLGERLLLCLPKSHGTPRCCLAGRAGTADLGSLSWHRAGGPAVFFRLFVWLLCTLLPSCIRRGLSQSDWKGCFFWAPESYGTAWMTGGAGADKLWIISGVCKKRHCSSSQMLLVRMKWQRTASDGLAEPWFLVLPPQAPAGRWSSHAEHWIAALALNPLLPVLLGSWVKPHSSMAANLHLIRLPDCLVDFHGGGLPEKRGRCWCPAL